MKRIGLLTALRLEIPAIIPYKKSDNVQVYQIGQKNIGVLVSGIGQKNALNALTRLYQEFSPNYLILTGFCGGVVDKLNIGDLLVPQRVHYNGQKTDLSSSQLENAIRFLSGSDIRHRIGDIQTFDGPVLSRHGVLETVVGVDMEAYAVSKASQSNGLPLVIVKAVSDIVPNQESQQRVDIKNAIREGKKALINFLKNILKE